MGISSNAGGIPIGAELAYHGGTIPNGFLLEYGQTVLIATYPALYSVLGTIHGGDGVTTFGIPDSRGRNTVGKDDMGGTPANRVTVGGSGIAGATLGANGGGESVTITAGQIPSHYHIEGMASNAGGDSGRYGITDTGVGVTRYSLTAGPDGRSPHTSNVGSGGAHSTMPPSLVANKIIKAF